jgi:hypothetical protein
VQRRAGQQPKGEGCCRHQRQQRPAYLLRWLCSCECWCAADACWQGSYPRGWQLWQAGIAPAGGAGAAGGSGGGGGSLPLSLLGRLEAARPSPLLLGRHTGQEDGVEQE